MRSLRHRKRISRTIRPKTALVQEFRREVRVAQTNSSSPSVLILLGFPITCLPRGSFLLLHILTPATIVQLVRSPRAAGDRLRPAPASACARGARDVRWKVLEGRRLACWRAARRDDLVHTVGAAVGQVMAGSWTESGNAGARSVGTSGGRGRTAPRASCKTRSALGAGNLEVCTAALAEPCGVISGSLEKAMLVTRSTSPRPRSRRARCRRGARCAIDGRPARRQGVGLTESRS